MALGIRKRISTHVLDTTLGKPAVGIPMRLERRQSSGNWSVLGTGVTDQDGRCGQLLPDETALATGLYRLVFDTHTYFADKRIASLYPVIEVTFQVRDGESTFHIPLLLSPNGYTTYRGT
jgi:5-hydroxyisourate hydrolase